MALVVSCIARWGALRLGSPFHHFIERVTSRLASDDESSALQLTPGSPVLAITRTAYDTDGTPVETSPQPLRTDLRTTCWMTRGTINRHSAMPSRASTAVPI
ncbi:MAG: UTRA domain-containing protein [Pseudonocardiaceae bacterium]